MNSIDFESLLVIIFVLVDDWYQLEGKFLKGRCRGAKAEMSKARNSNFSFGHGLFTISRRNTVH